MISVYSLLSRVSRLEVRSQAPRLLLETAYGSVDAFEDKVHSDISAGKLDMVEMPMVLAALRRWQSDRHN